MSNSRYSPGVSEDFINSLTRERCLPMSRSKRLMCLSVTGRLANCSLR
jgi:hypothetical protein